MISLNTRMLTRAIDNVATGIARRNPIPALAAMRMRRDGDDMILSSTDLDVQIDARIPAEMNGSALDAAIFSPTMIGRALRLSGGEMTSVAQEDAAVRFGCEALGIHAPGVNTDDWPGMDIARDAATFFASLGDEAMSAIRKASGAMSTEETRYYLNGVYIHKGDGPWNYVAVATDGHRLNAVEFPLPDAEGSLPSNFIIPRRTIGLLLRLAKQAGDRPIELVVAPELRRNVAPNMLAVTTGHPLVEFQVGNLDIRSKIIDGTFPDYKRAIPIDHPVRAVFNRAGLRRAIQAVAAGAMKERRATKLEMADGIATISCQWGPDEPKGAMSIPFEGNARVVFGINSDYLLNAIDVYSSESITLAMAEGDAASNPMLVVSQEDASTKVAVMPMRF